MMKPQTQRAKEYFEVLDELRQEGYIVHEEWLITPPEGQQKRSKLTNRLLEEALFEHGYSRGSPAEQKKYRNQWLKARGIDIQQESSSTLLQDPVIHAVENFKKQIEQREEERADQAISQAQQKVNEFTEKYKNLEADYYAVVKEKDILFHDLSQLKQDHQKLTSEYHATAQQAKELQKILDAKIVAYDEALKNEKEHAQSLLAMKEESLQALKTQGEKDQQYYRGELSAIKENAEAQRHQHIAIIDALKVGQQKLEKTLQKAEIIEQQTREKNQLLQQQIKAQSHELELQKAEIAKYQYQRLESEKTKASLQTEIRFLQDSVEQGKEEKSALNKNLEQERETIIQMEMQLRDQKGLVRTLTLELEKTKKRPKDQD